MQNANYTSLYCNMWSLKGLNLGPTDYESVALTNCAKGPKK